MKKMPMHHTVHCTLPFSQSAELHMGNDHKLSFPCIGKKLLFFTMYSAPRQFANGRKGQFGNLWSNSFSNTSLPI